MAESWGDKLVVYLYDSAGSPIGMQYRQTDYEITAWDTFWFEKNLQGDIVAVYNESGTKVATYTYSDAWGNHSVSYINGGASTGAQYNPFRYRGYYYDTDLGMYYLQSRYYDAKICRFINADSALYHSMFGYNMFAYCGNNPVNRFDSTGKYYEDLWDSDGNPLNDGLFDGITGGGGTYYIGPGSAYYNYAVYSRTAVSDALLGGYYAPSLSSGILNTSYYYVYGAISVIDSMATDFLSSGACFVKGTLVKTSEGDVPIENIQVGDYVYAHNPETGETELKPVVNTFVNEATELVHVFADGEEIICTNEHPFYSPVKGWTEACKLRSGDILVSLNGEYVVVEQVQHEILEAPIKVYNFEVEDFHTYFVGDGNGVLVHNSCGPNLTYEDAPYHTNGNSVKSPRPIDGQAALDNSFPISSNSHRRIGVSNGQFVVLPQTSPGVHHGYVVQWDELTNQMKSVLYQNGVVGKNGKIK